MRVLVMILAGGKGRRLYPLTRHRTKPAVPFGGNFRIIDFTLSNMVNSGLSSIYVLVQYRSQSLIEHLRMGWRARGITNDQFITVVPPQMRHGESWYRGSADAVTQNLNLVQGFRADVLAVFAGDLVYRMEARQMIDFHRRSGAEVTLACSPVPVATARGRLGVVRVGADGRIAEFVEKPRHPDALACSPDHVMGSMGCFLFNAPLLIERLSQAGGSRPLDLSADVFPWFVERGMAAAYNFADNCIPGQKPYERSGYWCDIGTIPSYWAAHMDLLGREPAFDLRNPEWPIYPARVNLPPTSFQGVTIEDALVGEGGRIESALIRRSVIGRGVTIQPGARIEDSVVMDYTQIGAGAVLRRAIVDRFNWIEPGQTIVPGAELEGDRIHLERASRLVVLSRGGIAPPPEHFPVPAEEHEGLGAF